MTPREIDALVAERVMGLVPCSNPIGKCDMAAKGLCWGTGGAGTDLHAYSTDIAAAWQVVEKLHAYNPFWECAAGNENFPGIALSPTIPPGWHCNFGDDTTHAYAATAPMAICKAALKAVGVEVP